ncbi:glycosyltransferase family 4 protein [methane-oxidizing endosymbiont of Gigantopelta aegis]|uniref:glycosyltransferase family 4 protein n=1 Tax=methane-oxidizing endosymbiont of Gigantopelta aegis TaxID=2794938 RepID=UPI001FD9BB7B|nr:glycosyltransferase family 4 protein [methane-oxidizing endosymbiont of Gigantopelta aegis]
MATNPPYPKAWMGKIKGIRAIFRLLPYLVKIWKLAGQVEVIHVFSNSGWSWQLFSAPVLWIASVRKTPVIINYRGGEAQRYFEQSIAVVRPSMKRAQRIVVPSGYLAAVFQAFNIDNVMVIPNIINLERFRPKKHEQGYHLIITRNLEAIYGIETAIKSLELIKKDYPQVKLTIAGSGEQKDYLQQQVSALGLEDNVCFTGKLTPDEVVALYQQADIMLNPTTVDNMPNSVLESMACGVPVVTTNVGGIPFIVEDDKTALLVDVGDFEMMAKKVMTLFKDESLYQRLVTNGLAEVQRYSWPNVKQQWLSLYSTVANQ